MLFWFCKIYLTLYLFYLLYLRLEIYFKV
jgi:hypothetical protein